MGLDAMKWAFDQPTKDPYQKLVLLCITDHYNEDLGYSEWSSLERIARITCCDERTVQRKINDLVKVGYINKVRRGFGKTNIYYLPLYDIYKGKTKSIESPLMNGQRVQSRTDTGVHSRTDSRVRSGHDTSVHQTQYQHKSNTNNMFGSQRVQSERKELTFKQTEFVKTLIERLRRKMGSPEYAYTDLDKVEERLKQGMLKKDGSFEKTLEDYNLG